MLSALLSVVLSSGPAAPHRLGGEVVDRVLAQVEEEGPSRLRQTIGFKEERAKLEEPGPLWVPWAIGGGALVLTGGVFWGMAKNVEYRLLAGDGDVRTRPEVEALVARGRAFEAVAWSGLGLGLAVAATGVVLDLTAPAEQPALSFAITPGGGALVLSGRLP